jgi:hypothetical protein
MQPTIVTREKVIMEKNKWKTGRAPSLAAAALAALAFSPPGWANADTGSFPVVAGTAHILGAQEGSDFSWDQVFDAKGQVLSTAGASRAVFINDDVSVGKATDLTALAQGSNNLVRNAVVAADQDIGHAYAALIPDKDGSLVLYGAAERLGDGDGNMTFEFNQKSAGLGDGGFGKGLPWDMIGDRTQGDILLRLNFAGGQIASADVSRWEGASDAGSFHKVGTLADEGCNDSGTFCAVSNNGDIKAGPWANVDPSGDAAIIQAHRFVEFKINAGALLGKQPDYASLCVLTPQDVAFDSLKRGGN